jgi:hypothetical protein
MGIYISWDMSFCRGIRIKKLVVYGIFDTAALGG